MDYNTICTECLNNLNILSLFIHVCAAFELYFCLLLFSFMGNVKWSSMVANRRVVMCLLVTALLASLYIAYRCFMLETTSLLGIFSIMVIVVYLFYLHYFDPWGMELLPSRLQKAYLLFVVISIFLSLIKMFLDMTAFGGVYLNALTGKIMLEQFTAAQEMLGPREENSGDKPFIHSPLEGPEEIKAMPLKEGDLARAQLEEIPPVLVEGTDRGLLINLIDKYVVTPQANKIIDSETSEETKDLERGIIAGLLGSNDAPKAYRPEDVDMNMANNGGVFRQQTLLTPSGDVPAVVVCIDRVQITALATNRVDALTGAALNTASKTLLTNEPVCFCAHADTRKGFIEEPILRPVIEGVQKYEHTAPPSPSDHDIQSQRLNERNL